MLDWVSVFQGGGLKGRKSPNEKLNKGAGAPDEKTVWVVSALTSSSEFPKLSSDEMSQVL